MKLFVDDVRDPLDNTWTVIRTVRDAQILLCGQTHYKIEECSLDHDLGENQPMPLCVRCDEEATAQPLPNKICEKPCGCSCHSSKYVDGSYLVRWMVDSGCWPVNEPVVHSADPVGAAYMKGVIETYFPLRETK